MKKIILEIDEEVIRKVEHYLWCKSITEKMDGEDDALLVILFAALDKNLEKIHINEAGFTSILNMLLNTERRIINGEI